MTKEKFKELMTSGDWSIAQILQLGSKVPKGRCSDEGSVRINCDYDAVHQEIIAPLIIKKGADFTTLVDLAIDVNTASIWKIILPELDWKKEFPTIEAMLAFAVQRNHLSLIEAVISQVNVTKAPKKELLLIADAVTDVCVRTGFLIAILKQKTFCFRSIKKILAKPAGREVLATVLSHQKLSANQFLTLLDSSEACPPPYRQVWRKILPLLQELKDSGDYERLITIANSPGISDDIERKIWKDYIQLPQALSAEIFLKVISCVKSKHIQYALKGQNILVTVEDIIKAKPDVGTLRLIEEHHVNWDTPIDKLEFLANLYIKEHPGIWNTLGKHINLKEIQTNDERIRLCVALATTDKDIVPIRAELINGINWKEISLEQLKIVHASFNGKHWNAEHPPFPWVKIIEEVGSKFKKDEWFEIAIAADRQIVYDHLSTLK